MAGGEGADGVEVEGGSLCGIMHVTKFRHIKHATKLWVIWEECGDGGMRALHCNMLCKPRGLYGALQLYVGSYLR